MCPRSGDRFYIVKLLNKSSLPKIMVSSSSDCVRGRAGKKLKSVLPEIFLWVNFFLTQNNAQLSDNMLYIDVLS